MSEVTDRISRIAKELDKFIKDEQGGELPALALLKLKVVADDLESWVAYIRRNRREDVIDVTAITHSG